MADNRMLWIDMETTGLDAQNDIPLELGLRLTDSLGYTADIEADSFTCLIWESGLSWSMKLGNGAAHKIVGPMHEKSGLWTDIYEKRRKETLTRIEAEVAAIDWLKSRGVEKFTLPLHGSSIGSLDRPFLIEHFPMLNEFTHYRNVDTSTLKELCKRHNPELYAKLPEAWTKIEMHRVQEDITDSINEYLFYVENFLFIGEDI